MAQPWQTIETVATPHGTLELRRRGEADFLITVAGLVLMNSSARRSEEALGALACGHLGRRRGARVLVGGLGMGYTLRAVLDCLHPTARVTVAELTPAVVEWCRGPLAGLTRSAVDDPRVRVEIADVAQVLRRHTQGGNDERLDAVVLDLYEGPGADTHRRDDPLYGERAIATTRAALRPDGVFAVWGEGHDPGFMKRLRTGGFTVTSHRPGRGGLRHEVYLARPAALSRARPRGAGG